MHAFSQSLSHAYLQMPFMAAALVLTQLTSNILAICGLKASAMSLSNQVY